eukprot:gene8697-644_t
MTTTISKQEFENMFLGFDDDFLNTVGDENGEDLTLSQNNRDWKIKYRNEEVIGLMANLRILLKSRNDQAMEFIPERLYSSLKYEMVHEMESVETPILLVKIQIIDPKTQEEIMINDNSILLGNPEGVLTKVDGKHFLKNKVHFSDVPPQKREYSMRVCYYLPSDLMQPVLVVHSPNFKIFTRRNPNDIITTSFKRKREVNIDKGNAKKAKVDLNKYLSQLDELLQLKNKLSKDEQKEALDLAISKLHPQNEIKKETTLEEEYESIKFEDLFTPKDCATYEAITDNFDFDFNNELDTCIF